MREERTTRLCTRCGAEKPTDEFPMKVGSKAQKSRRYRSHVCRGCRNDQNKAWFARHPGVRPAANRTYWNKDDPRYPDRLARHREQQRARRAANYALMDERKKSGCTDCGEMDIRVLQFDHVRGKTTNLAVMSLSSAATFTAELDRCEVRCANCHARITYERRQKSALDKVR